MHAEAFGDGADWLIASIPDLVGRHDRPHLLQARHDVVADAQARFPGVRLSRSSGVWHALIPAILAQRVTGGEAMRAWAQLCAASGVRAPGPVALLLPPTPEFLSDRPYWWYHRFGVERRRADTIRRASAAMARCPDAAAEVHMARLAGVVGVGRWTLATVADAALGDPDAVAVGDFHLKNVVSYALANEARGTDERMLELLEPYAGQRNRVIRLLLWAGITPPRFGARHAIMPIARW